MKYIVFNREIKWQAQSSHQMRKFIFKFDEDGNEDDGFISFKKGDYMIVHSTLRGFVSNRHRYMGTVFIQELTKSIQELMRKESHNFEEVIRSACFEASNHQSSGTNAPQVPEFITTLRAPFRFVLKGNSKTKHE